MRTLLVALALSFSLHATSLPKYYNDYYDMQSILEKYHNYSGHVIYNKNNYLTVCNKMGVDFEEFEENSHRINITSCYMFAKYYRGEAENYYFEPYSFEERDTVDVLYYGIMDSILDRIATVKKRIKIEEANQNRYPEFCSEARYLLNKIVGGGLSYEASFDLKVLVNDCLDDGTESFRAFFWQEMVPVYEIAHFTYQFQNIKSSKEAGGYLKRRTQDSAD